MSSRPVDPGDVFRKEGTPTADLTIVAAELEDRAGAVAIASMRRAPRAEHEELWVQFFVDDVFVDVVRALELDDERGDAVFIARFVVPPYHLDGIAHRARASFVTAVSRAVARGEITVRTNAVTESGPEAVAEVDFVATPAARHRHSG